MDQFGGISNFKLNGVHCGPEFYISPVEFDLLTTRNYLKNKCTC